MTAPKTANRCDANKTHGYDLDCGNSASFAVSISTEFVADVCGHHLADTVRLFHAAVPDGVKTGIRVQPTR